MSLLGWRKEAGDGVVCWGDLDWAGVYSTGVGGMVHLEGGDWSGLLGGQAVAE